MATTNVVNSTLFKLWTGATPAAIQHLNDVSLTVNHAPRDITTKDAGGWKTLLEGLRSYTLSSSGLVAFDDTNGGPALEAGIRNRTFTTWTIGTGVTGDPKYSGSGYITSLDQKSPAQEQNVSFTLNLEGSGQYYVGTY